MQDSGELTFEMVIVVLAMPIRRLTRPSYHPESSEPVLTPRRATGRINLNPLAPGQVRRLFREGNRLPHNPKVVRSPLFLPRNKAKGPRMRVNRKNEPRLPSVPNEPTKAGDNSTLARVHRATRGKRDKDDPPRRAGSS